MKNKTVVEYENKRWYRILKVLYIFFFILILVIYNFGFEAIYFYDGAWPFIIGNLIIIFAMGTIEGLFWYIARGEWGYPKDDEIKINSMIKKETHPEIFEQRTKAFKEAYLKDPNYGFEEGYVPTEKEREEHGVPPSKKLVTLISTEGKSKEQIKKEVKDQLISKGLLK